MPEILGARANLPSKLRTQDQIDALGLRIANAIRAGVRAKGRLAERIALNEKLARNVNVKPSKLPWPDAQHFHIPMLGPKLTQRKANIVKTLTGQNPMIRLTHIGDRVEVDKVERTIQFFLDIAGFREALDKAVWMAMEANQPIWRIAFQDYPEGFIRATHTGHFAGVVFDIIHPNQFVCWPATEVGVDGARFCGHAFDITVSEVKDMVRDGLLLKHDPVPTSKTTVALVEAESSDTILDQNADSGEASDELVMLYEGLWRDKLDDDEDRLYRVVVNEEANQLLLIEPYPYQFPWYVPMPIKKEPGKFWAEGSPAQDVQGLQLLLNSLVNEYIWGTQMNSRPAILTEGWALDESVVGYEPGEVRDVRSIGKATPVPASFSAAGYDALIQFVRSMADMATKTSDAVTGAPSVSRESTATEQNIKWTAFQIGASDDITMITPAIRRIIVVMLDQLASNFDVWYPVYRDSVPVEDVSQLQKSFVIDIAGKSPEDSPQLQSQQAQMLLQMVQAVPALGIPEVQRQLLNSIIVATTLPNKDAIIRAINQAMGAPQNMEVPNAPQETNNGQGIPPELASLLQLQGVPGDAGGPGGLEELLSGVAGQNPVPQPGGVG